MTSPLTIGIVGGMSPESTVTYYRHIVRRHQAECGDHGYPRIVIASVSFQQYIEWQHEGWWRRIADELAAEFQSLAAAGADFAVLATNTMHKVLPQINSPIPVLNMLDVVAHYAESNGLKSLGLTGTRFTMSDGFYTAGLEERGLSVLLPTESEQGRIHNIIYDELILGKIIESSVRDFNEISQGLINRGADAVLLGCTELELLTRENPTWPLFVDTTRAHAAAAWEVANGKHPWARKNFPARLSDIQ